MASLESLPAPLPLQILNQLPDLMALDAARRSCAMFAAVFENHACELLEHLMSSTLFDDVIVEIRLYILLLDTEGRINRDNTQIETLRRQAGEPLPRTTAFQAISCALRDFSYLASVCDVLLCDKLRRLQNLTYQHLKDGTFSYQRGGDPEGTEYTVPALSSPHWIEQQRTFLALWTLQTSYRLNSASQPPLDRWEGIVDILDEIEISCQALHISFSHAAHGHPIFWAALARMPLPETEADPVDVAWRDTREDAFRRASRVPKGYTYFHNSCRKPRCLLRELDWKVLRSLGLGIWSDRRMAEELQLLNPPLIVTPPPPGYPYIPVEHNLTIDGKVFTWKALYMEALRFKDVASRGHDLLSTRNTA